MSFKFIALGCLLFCVFYTCFKKSKVKDSINITANEAFEMIENNVNNPNFIILDVRTLREFQRGYIENAINIDFYKNNFIEQIKKLDKSKTYFVYCRSGNRSGQAVVKMQDLNFQQTYNLANGINAWKKDNYPVIK